MPPCLLGAHTIEAVGGNPCILELRGPLELPSPGGETEAQSRGATCPGVPQSLGSPHTAHGALPFSHGHLPRWGSLPFLFRTTLHMGSGIQTHVEKGHLWMRCEP